jgi:putative ABC transport system permease protein
MIIHFLKIAYRNLTRQKGLAFINVIGLSIGLACFSLFLLFAIYQFSFDRFQANAANIYRVVEWWQGLPGREPGGEAYGGTPLGPAMKHDFADVENAVRIQTGFDEKFIRANEKTIRSKVSFVDPEFFSVFSFKLIRGERNTLENPRSIVLTRERAMQLFGGTDVVGKRVDIKLEKNFEPFTVGAVVEDIPGNSSISFSILGSFGYLMTTDMGKESLNNWHMQIGCETYVQLHNGSALVSHSDRLAQFRKKYFPDEESELKKDGIWDGKKPYPASFRLQNLHNIHTGAHIEGIASTMDTKYIWILISIATGVLLIACINFTTLAIGRSAGRAREVGVRKVMGSGRKQLIYQFLAESVSLSVISALIAILMAILVLPYFNQLADTKISFSFSQYPELAWMLLGLTLITGLLAGAYPALVLSGFNPTQVLKSKIRLGGSNFFTKSLVTMQFVLSIGLIISTIIILQQTKYMRSKDIGFNKENVVVVDAEGSDMDRNFQLFKRNLVAGGKITGVAGSEMGLGAGTGLMRSAFDYKGETKGIIMYPVDAGFLKVMGMKLIAGRDFDPTLSIDTVSSIIVNEAMLRDFNLTTGNAIGQQLTEKQFDTLKVPRVIIGVIRDFNYSSLNEKVRPQIFIQPASLHIRSLFLRIKSGEPSRALSSIEAAWKQLTPGLPFQYSFLDENIDRFYKAEARWSKIVGAAGFISIFLACLGLFGLASLAAVNRTKEIGIRKVLGAPVSSIIKLISKDFLKLVIIALLIAIPLVWYFMNKWLEGYAYRIDIGWWVFILTAMLVILIAFATISLQAIKAAIMNPVTSLRSE